MTPPLSTPLVRHGSGHKPGLGITLSMHVAPVLEQAHEVPRTRSGTLQLDQVSLALVRNPEFRLVTSAGHLSRCSTLDCRSQFLCQLRCSALAHKQAAESLQHWS